LPGPIRVGNWRDFSTHGRDPQQPGPTCLREENHPGAAPRTTVRCPQYLAKRLNRPARELDLLEPVVGEEADEAAVRRPEGEDRALRTGERLGFGGIERAHPKLHVAAGRRGEGQMTAIRRHSDLVKTRLLRWQDGSLKNPRL